ncbi:MAG: hypothetical protein ACRDM1_00980 [Gaiellaceae bacterium]
MRRRPEEIIGEWGIRDVTPASQRERARLESDRDVNPLIGKPLRRRLRNFRAEADNYLASLGGPLPYMQRLRQIEAETERHLERLREAYEAHRRDPDGWRAYAEGWDFTDVNDLIARHNRWYPVEARLPMNPRTRDFVEVGGRPYLRRPLDAAWILARFP